MNVHSHMTTGLAQVKCIFVARAISATFSGPPPRSGARQIGIVCAQILGALSLGECDTGIRDHAVGCERARPVRHFALHRKHILSESVPALGPEMRCGRAVDQLSGEAQLIALTLDRPLQHIGDVADSTDLAHGVPASITPPGGQRLALGRGQAIG
jgi:hypothetical protein